MSPFHENSIVLSLERTDLNAQRNLLQYDHKHTTFFHVSHWIDMVAGLSMTPRTPRFETQGMRRNDGDAAAPWESWIIYSIGYIPMVNMCTKFDNIITSLFVLK